MSIYNKFATVYDKMGADEHSVLMVEYCRKIFNKFDILPETGLDLCCGTGTAILNLANQGIKMSGLDQSAKMLAVAAKKLKNKKITLYQKSLPKFKILDNSDGKIVKFDLITSFYDSLNYLNSEAQLKASFKTTARHLNKGGWFIFDMNTPNSLRTIWNEQTYTGVTNDLVWIWQNDFNQKNNKATVKATFFKKNGKHWERFDELHTEYAHSNITIKKLLRESGFIIKGFYHCYKLEKPSKDSYRICVVAQKK